MTTLPSIHAQRAALHAIGIAALLMLATPAQAQVVRKCQVDGRVVFQAAPCAIEARADAAVAAAAPQPAPAAGPRKKTLAEVLHERDGADLTRPISRPLQSDGATVLRARMGAV